VERGKGFFLSFGLSNPTYGGFMRTLYTALFSTLMVLGLIALPFSASMFGEYQTDADKVEMNGHHDDLKGHEDDMNGHKDDMKHHEDMDKGDGEHHEDMNHDGDKELDKQSAPKNPNKDYGRY
jgi:hypothetical protein